MHVFPTVEVRWFYEGRVPPDVLAWFQESGRGPEEPSCRVDYYLRFPDRDCLGIKLREGRLEIKRRCHDFGVVRLHESVVGRVEHWRKWSLELAQNGWRPAGRAAPSSAWVAVRKERRLRTYRLAGEGADIDLAPEVVAVDAESCSDQGGDWELTAVNAGDRTWWSVCFEAFGDESTLRETLVLVVRHVLSGGVPRAFDAAHSYGYARWLGTWG